MDKSKFIPLVFLIIILGVGFVAYKFYTDNQILVSENQTLKKEKAELDKINRSLESKYERAAKEKKDLEDRWSKVEEELSRLEDDKDRWQKKYEEIFKEREDLLAKLESLKTTSPRQQVIERITEKRETVAPSIDSPQEYWVDFVKIKAELEVELSALKQDYLNASNDILRLETENKELSIKVDELAREKDSLTREIAFKTRTIDIMSRDVVNEREDRRKMLVEVDQLRKENADLKREVILTNKERMRLQEAMKETKDKKQILERKVSEVENLLKEKSLVFEELKDQLNKAVKTESMDEAVGQSTAVELPPIVVKPQASKLQGFRGEVIAVNREEKFVVLDLGEASGIRPGMQLSVMRADKEIGTVEIIETRKEISAADIKESKAAIREGDIVVSK